MTDVAAIGELLIDFTCKAVDQEGYPTMEAHPGGAPANFLAALAKQGFRTAMVGKVGADAFGGMLTATLRQAGIDTRGIVSDPEVFTTLAFVTLDSRGDRSFSFARKPGADTALRFDEVDLGLLDETRVLHFGTLSLTDEPARTATKKAVAYAKERGKTVTFDPNLRKPLWRDPDEARAQMLWGLAQADIVKISEEEVAFLWGEGPQEGAERILRDFGVKLVFVTLGPEGCFFQNRLARGHEPALQGIRPVDTTGAGDIFGGSALAKLLQLQTPPQDLTEAQIRQVVRFACTAAGLSTTKPGGISSIPSREAVLANL